MSLPNVNIVIGNGNLGRVAASTDATAGMIVHGVAVPGKLELTKLYTLSSTRDLDRLGIIAEATTEGQAINPLAFSEIANFYAQAGEGAELHLIVVADTMTPEQIVDSAAASPLCKLIEGAGGRIRIVSINYMPSQADAAAAEKQIEKLAAAVAKAHKCAENYAARMMPFRILLPFAPVMWDETASEPPIYKPNEGSYNRVGVVAICNASGSCAGYPSPAIALGRAAAIEPQMSIGRVKDGAVLPDAKLPNGKTFKTQRSISEILDAAGYVTPIGYPTKNGAYLNGGPMATTITDDYSDLSLGRIIDKAVVVVYNTYITEIQDNITVSQDGGLPPGVCVSFSSMLENAIAASMGRQISSFSVAIDSTQNVLSTGRLEIQCKIVPMATLREINVNLSFENPALTN